MVLTRLKVRPELSPPESMPIKHRWQRGPLSYLIALAAVALMTGLICVTHADASMVNIPPLYLLAVQAVAVAVGSRAAILASIVSFLTFDWFFVEPRYQFTVRDPFEFVALCVFLATAILVGQLTALFQSRALEAHRRELAASALAQASWTVAVELNRDAALHDVLEQLSIVESAQYAAVLMPDAAGKFSPVVEHRRVESNSELHSATISDAALKFVSDSRQQIGWDDGQHWKKALSTSPEKSELYLPVTTEGEMFGIFYMEFRSGRQLLAEDRQVISSLVNHIAVVLQRDKLVAAKTRAQALIEANKLKTALLQMVSHDFRSPLASIKASVSTLLVEEGAPLDSSTQQSLLQGIEKETDRLNRMVGNLLDLSRLEANAWQPNRELNSLTELIGAALDTFSAEDNSRVIVNLPDEPLEVYVDFAQTVQVLKNLIENALKYSAADRSVTLNAERQGDWVQFDVLDNGPGLPQGEEHLVFEPFYRARQHRESSVPGVGMGLAICRGLVEAQGGTLKAYNRETGGAVFCARLPMMSMVSK